jgi:hypothetical protein
VPRALGDAAVDEAYGAVVGHGAVTATKVGVHALPGKAIAHAGTLPLMVGHLGPSQKFWHGKTGPIKVPYFSGRNPNFYPYQFYSVRLKDLGIANPEKLTDPQQFREAMKALKLEMRAHPEMWDNFSPQQQQSLIDAFGDLSKDTVSSHTAKGFTWHHDSGDPEFGTLLLLDFELHDFNKHDGGRAVTGGRG